MANLDIWDKLSRTDPAHTKGFKRAGGFSGTAIKPIYTEQKMTETFGPCGVGWGIDEPHFQTAIGNDGQMAVYCWVSIWINHDGKVSAPIFGVGGDMVVVKQSSGLRTDDEAFKKAFTDAIGNAMKHLGMSADVHMGLFDDSKYVRERQEEEAAKVEDQPTSLSKFKGRPLDGELRAEMDICETAGRLDVLWHSPKFQVELRKLPTDWQEHMQTTYAERMTAFANMAAAKDDIIASLRAATSTPDLKARWEKVSKEVAQLTEPLRIEVEAAKDEMKAAIKAVEIASTP